MMVAARAALTVSDLIMKSPAHLWIIGSVTLLWNLIGAADYTLTQMRYPSYMAHFTAEQVVFVTSCPVWAQATWAIGVWGGLAGSLLLLRRSALAVIIFALSLLGAIATDIYSFGLAPVKMHEIAGQGALWFAAVIFVIAVAEWLYARRMRQLAYLS